VSEGCDAASGTVDPTTDCASSGRGAAPSEGRDGAGSRDLAEFYRVFGRLPASVWLHSPKISVFFRLHSGGNVLLASRHYPLLCQQCSRYSASRMRSKRSRASSSYVKSLGPEGIRDGGAGTMLGEGGPSAAWGISIRLRCSGPNRHRNWMIILQTSIRFWLVGFRWFRKWGFDEMQRSRRLPSGVLRLQPVFL
jgi:hypothetical protein